METLFFFFHVLLLLYNSCATPLLLLISFDGFRYDFIDPSLTPNIWELSKQGVHAVEGIRPQTATITLPNHQSMITGLYEESHGIIDNIFYDKSFGDYFDLLNLMKNGSKVELSRKEQWFKGIPAWKHNMLIKNRSTGCISWPGCDVKYGGAQPRMIIYQEPGDISMWKSHIDTMLEWFLDPNNPINFGLYYNAEPDNTEHVIDIFSDEVKKVVKQLDDLIGYLIKKLNETRLSQKMNIILTSDHGFANIRNESYSLDLSEYVDKDKVIWSGQSIFPQEDVNSEEIYDNLTRAVKNGLKIKVWRKEDFPNKYHWKNNARVGPIIIFNDFRYVNEPAESKDMHFYPYGAHTYLNDDDQLRSIFVASGPSLKPGFEFASNEMEIVDIYPLICNILALKEMANNGSFDRVKIMLKNKAFWSNMSPLTMFPIFAIVVISAKL